MDKYLPYARHGRAVTYDLIAVVHVTSDSSTATARKVELRKDSVRSPDEVMRAACVRSKDLSVIVDGEQPGRISGDVDRGIDAILIEKSVFAAGCRVRTDDVTRMV